MGKQFNAPSKIRHKRIHRFWRYNVIHSPRHKFTKQTVHSWGRYGKRKHRNIVRKLGMQWIVLLKLLSRWIRTNHTQDWCAHILSLNDHFLPVSQLQEMSRFRMLLENVVEELVHGFSAIKALFFFADRHTMFEVRSFGWQASRINILNS